MKAQDDIPFLDEIKETFGKDEMNLAEYPISLLSRKPVPGITMIEYSENGMSWKVTGSAEYGLPIGGDQDIYVAIMESWKENDFTSRTIEIGSIYGLLKKVGVSTSKRDYERFKMAVKRLAGITIYAENAFYDNAGKKYDTVMGFHLFDEFRIITRRVRDCSAMLPKGYIRASEVLWASVKKGYVKSLDLRFYAELSSPCAKRVYRFLDKKLYYGRHFKMGLFRFAKKMGLMAGLTRYYPSHIKKDLTPALEELKAKGFLKSFKYERSVVSGEETLTCVFRQRHLAIEPHEEKTLLMDIVEFTGSEHSIPYYQKMIRGLGCNAANLIYHALSSAREADRVGDIKTSRDQYFIGTLERITSQ